MVMTHCFSDGVSPLVLPGNSPPDCSISCSDLGTITCSEGVHLTQTKMAPASVLQGSTTMYTGVHGQMKQDLKEIFFFQTGNLKTVKMSVRDFVFHLIDSCHLFSLHSTTFFTWFWFELRLQPHGLHLNLAASSLSQRYPVQVQP